MNERIKELADHANGPNPFFGTLKGQMTLLGNDAVEKFAELIIQDVLTLIATSDAKCQDEWDFAERDLYAEIQKHFGAE